MNLDSLRSQVAVSAAFPERAAHARDLWPRGTLTLARGEGLPPIPEAVAWPRDEAEIAACLAWAALEGVAVVPYGAGSGVCGAAAGRAGALALDLKRMNRVGPLLADRTGGQAVRVQPGVLGQHLEDALERSGRATRHSPSSIWCSTVGGWAASRSAGQFSSKYGKFEDMVLAMRVVAPSGVFGTGVWADGEDLGPWVMGSEGALGVISELLVRTVALPEARRFGAWRFESVEAAWRGMRGLLQAELHPAVVRLYDPVDTRIAGKGSATKAEGSRWLADLQRAVESVPGLRKHMLSLPLALPRLTNHLLRGISSGCVLIAGWEGRASVIEVLARHGATLLAEGQPLGEELGEHWYAHRHEVSYKSAPIFERGGFADTMEVASTWARLPALYAGVREAIGRHALVMAHFSHVYREGCSIYFSFGGRGDLGVYDATWRDALAAAAAAGGTVAHHHGVGQLKAAAAARELAGIAPMFHALKARLDPAGILNPGRMFPGVGDAVAGAEPPGGDPPAPELGIDPVSQCATLAAWEPASVRDARLAEAGWILRNPTARPLAESVSDPAPPWETPVVGASARLATGRAVFVPVPRSSAGPDPRRCLPAAAYETLTVPVVPIDGEVVVVPFDFDTCAAADLRPARRVPGGVEFRGPAAQDLAEAARALTVAARGGGGA